MGGRTITVFVLYCFSMQKVLVLLCMGRFVCKMVTWKFNWSKNKLIFLKNRLRTAAMKCVDGQGDCYGIYTVGQTIPNSVQTLVTLVTIVSPVKRLEVALRQ